MPASLIDGVPVEHDAASCPCVWCENIRGLRELSDLFASIREASRAAASRRINQVEAR